MASLTPMAFSSKQLSHNPSLILPFNSRFNLENMISLQRECNLGFCFLGEFTKGRIYKANSKRIYPTPNCKGQWEDPDDDGSGSGSEYKDENDEEDTEEGFVENDLDFESDWETVNDGKVIGDSVNKISTNKYEEDVVTGNSISAAITHFYLCAYKFIYLFPTVYWNGHLS